MEQFKLFLINNLDKIIASCCVIVFELIIMLVLRLTINRYIKKKSGKKKTFEEFSKSLLSSIRTFLFIMEVVVILTIWYINLFALLGFFVLVIIALIVGGKEVMADIFAGISLIFENYYEVGDVVEINGFKGKVIEVGLKSTKITNYLNEIRVITNSSIKEVTNYSKLTSVCNVNIRFDYDVNIDKVISILDEKLVTLKEQFEQIVEGPNVVGVEDLDDVGVVVRISVKTRPETQYSVERAIKKYVKELCEAEGIKLAHK